MASVSELTSQFTKYSVERDTITQMLKYPERLSVSISVTMDKSGQQFKCTEAEGVKYLQEHLAAVQTALNMLNSEIKKELDKETTPKTFNEVDMFEEE